MRARMTAQATGFLLLLLAAIAWGAVLGEVAFTHRASLLGMVSALLVTGLVFAWPFLNGARLRGAEVVQLRVCHLCGAFPVPRLPFCIRCGAYPKGAPARLA